jgi:hypothetical protein
MLDFVVLLAVSLGTGFVALGLAETVIRRRTLQKRPPAINSEEIRPPNDHVAVALHWAVFALVMGVVFGAGIWLTG